MKFYLMVGHSFDDFADEWARGRMPLAFGEKWKCQIYASGFGILF